MTFRACVAGILLLFCTFLAAAGVINRASLNADPRPNGVMIQWSSDNESGIAYYQIERSVQGNSSSFMVIVPRLLAKGSGQSYQYLDETAFKTTDSFYRYRITPLDAAGNPVVAEQQVTGVVLQNKVSSVRRTWGSIKAMFR